MKKISGDLIVSNPRAFLHRLADVHRTENAAITVLMYRKPEPKDAKVCFFCFFKNLVFQMYLTILLLLLL